MNRCRERTLQDLCDATPTISHPQITPILRGNFRMQGPIDEANCDVLTHMVTSENNKGFSSCSDIIEKVDCRGKSGTCNICSAPWSSCFHINKALMKSNDESAGENCAENIEIGQLSEVSTLAGMNTTSDSLSENALGKESSRTSNASVSDDSVVHSKSEAQRVPEGHDDCLSCVSGADEHANRKSVAEDSGIKCNKQIKISRESSDKVPHSSSPTGLHSQNSGLEIPLSESTDDATDLLKAQNTYSQASNGKYLSHDQNHGDVKDDKPSDTKNELLEGSTEHLDSLSPRVVASDVVCGDPPATTVHAIEKEDNMEVEIHPIDETDDSDMVEQDVKVCDICGDAGREDLLAICCRCSDGAEHTYCMREMLAKVPEGEWVCEECKTAERVRNERQEKNGRVDDSEKNNSSAQASSEYVNSSDVDVHRTKGYTRAPGKRHRDDADVEVSSVVKKPALESNVGSPKASSSSKTASLSRENSSKNLDKSKLHSLHRSSPDTFPVNDVSESASSASDLRVQNFRGTFSKSNSFSSLNSKPKVKLVDQVVIQRQKSAREHGSFRLKEGVVRSIGKSMSFKSTNSGRSESKTKMLSPRLSHIPDAKNTKQRIPLERQRSLRTEHPSTNSVIGTSMSSTSRIDKRPVSRGESSTLTTICNHHETKPVQTDGKSTALSRSPSIAARRTADLSSSLGEFKRPSIHSHRTIGVSSGNGVNNIEQKSNQTSLKEDSSPCPVVAERPSLNANEGVHDGLPRPRDLTNSGERMREFSGSRFGPTSVKSPRDESDNLKAAIEAAVLRKPGVYRKHRALGQSDDSSVSSVGCEVVAHQDHMSSSAGKKKLSSDAELPERPTTPRNLSADPLKQETLNNVRQSSLAPVEGLSSGGAEVVHIVPSSKDVFSSVPAATPLFLKSLSIPEHEYIWQGSFEICRSGKFVDSWDGIQAHVSTSASPKVVEAVNKFKSRIVLYEVPRLSTWPIQFLEHGVREDNIALFFFAKDLESYDKIYKVLLDNMMKNDLALKGNVDGVELLIFPSNQLPDKSQRWNMLFFLWGVFRGKKESSLQRMPESLNQFCAPRDIPPPIMSLPENRCSLRPITNDLFASKDANPVLEKCASEALQSLLASRANGDCGTKMSSFDQLDHTIHSSSSAAVQSDGAKQCQEMRGTCQEGGILSCCSPPLASRSSSCSGREQMLTQLDTPLDRGQSSHHSSKSVVGTLEESIGEGTKLDKACNQNQMKLKMDAGDPSRDGETPIEDERDIKDLNFEQNRWLSPLASRSSSCSGREQMLTQLDTPLDRRQSSHHSSKSVAGTLKESIGEGTKLDKACNQNQMKLKMDAGDPSRDGETPIEDDRDIKDLNLEQNRWLFNDKERMHPQSCMVPPTLYAGTSQVSLRNDDTCGALEEVNHVPSDCYTMQNRHHQACIETLIPECNENAERRFFPVESQPVKGIDLADESTSVPWKTTHLLEQDRLNDIAPNLELALGAERKPLTLGIQQLLVNKVDQKVNEEQHNVEQAGSKAEDDVSASLSLSLSFPFPEKELSTKPATRTEQQLMPERKRVSASMLLFRD